MTDEKAKELAELIYDFCNTTSLSKEKIISLLESKIKETINREKENG